MLVARGRTPTEGASSVQGLKITEGFAFEKLDLITSKDYVIKV